MSIDPYQQERDSYLRLLGLQSDPGFSLAELRNMTAGGANAYRAATGQYDPFKTNRPLNILDIGGSANGGDVSGIIAEWPGHEIYFPKVSDETFYEFTSPLTLHGTSRLVGGPGVVFKPTVDMFNDALVSLQDSSSVENIKIDCQEAARFGFWVEGEGNVLSNTVVENSRFHGHFVDSAIDPVFFNAKAFHCGRPVHPTGAGFFVSSADNPTFFRCQSDYSNEHGFYVLGGEARAAQFISPICRYNNGSGLSLREQGSSVFGGRFEGNANGLSVIYRIQTPESIPSRNVSIFGGEYRNNTGDREIMISGVEGATLVGVNVETETANHCLRTTSSAKRVTVVGGTFRNNHSGLASCMRFDDSDNVSVVGADIEGFINSGGYGIIASGVKGLTAVGNNIKKVLHGVYLTDSGSRAGDESFVAMNRYFDISNKLIDVSTGSNKFPGAAPAAATGTDAAQINSIITALKKAGVFIP